MIALITGGASCGKSAYAERLCLELGGRLVYLAAMRPDGPEALSRIEHHRAARAGKGFETVECFDGLEAAVQKGRCDGATALVESLGVLVANELFEKCSGEPAEDDAHAAEPAEDDAHAAEQAVSRALDTLLARSENTVIVGDEVGADGTAYSGSTGLYQDTLAAVASAVAQKCDTVVECIGGIGIAVKGKDVSAEWT